MKINDKKIIIIISIIGLLIVLLNLTSIFKKSYLNKKFYIETEVSKKCSIKRISNSNIYTYCLDSIEISDNKKKYELEDYFDSVGLKFGIQKMIDELRKDMIAKDGGTTFYKDKKNISNKGLTIIRCNTIEGNKDIYIGPKDMKYEKGFCK